MNLRSHSHTILVRFCMFRIGGWPAGAIKLPFRKLNSILCEQLGRAARGFLSEGGNRLASRKRVTLYYSTFCCLALSLRLSMSLRADDLRRATRAGRNRKTEIMQFDDRSDQAQAQSQALSAPAFV